MAMAVDARAETSPTLASARVSWAKGAYGSAESLYREAIEKGGLAPAEVLEGYVRLGAIRASLGKRDPALAAFRAASILDAGFVVPPEAGPKGAALAEQAKRDTERLGSIRFSIDVPKDVPAGKAFHVTAKLDAAHVPMVSAVSLTAKEGLTGKESVQSQKAAETVEFDVPSEITLPDGTVIVRVDALDARKNRIASGDARVTIGSDKPAAAVVAEKPAEPTPAKKGFWSSPWPYVVGGVALVGAGTAAYFVTRPPETVTVGAPRIVAN